MFSKPRQHTAELVWQAVGGIVKSSMSMELLKGCAEIVKKEKDGERTVDTMVATNLELAAKAADNTLRSDRFEAHLVTLVGTLQAENSHSRAFGFLVMRSLLERMSGAHQVEVANKALDALDLEQLPSLDDLAADESLEDAVKPETIGKAVVVKPSSKTTLAWLQVGVIAAIAKVPQPLNKTIDWFKDQDTMSRDAGDLYVSAIRKLYGVLNNSGTVPSLALGLLQILFASLKSDVLSFLAGIWTSDVTELQRLQTLALLQATAFLEAHVQEADGIDFQTILPALLAALHGSNAQSRLAALECLKRLQIVSQSKLTQVYKFDLIYGQNSEDLQYLDQADLQRYLEALLSHSDHFENDGAYLPAFHGQHLTKAPGDKKKDSEYRKRVLCYLLSHVNALSSTNMQITLLQSIGAVTNKAKLQLLLPTVQRLLRPNQSHHENLLLELLRSFNESASKDLNDSSKPFWKVYTDLLHHYLRPDTSEVSRNVLAGSLEKGLYAKLDASRQVELCKVFLKLCSEDASLQRFCKQLLTNILNEVPVIVGLLDFYSPSSHVGERASKRAKTSESSEQYSIRELSFLVEILGTKPLPGSIELISHLLQVLNSIVQNLSPTEAEINYTEQLLMSAVETAANGVSDILNLSPTAIRVDVLVELIRVTENPATFHQALLLMSNLTRLAPESVLHNVMPVFTFMGSNVFHRDDSYSFSVVQKTIDGIVPVMVSSLKKAHANPLDLWASSKDFLHVFTDAVNHIPRHRRTKFFTHLVDVLGTQDFLAPVSMLLVEKVANRVARQTGQDAQSPLELPVSLVNNAPLPIRIPSLVAILEEAQRLISRSVQPEKNVPIFLSPSSEADAHTATSPLKRRAQSLILFVGSTFTSPLPKSATTAAHPDLIVKGLVALATQDLPETHQDVIKTSLVALDRLLNVLSALDFIRSVSSMMDIDDERIRAGALDLLSKRLPNVSDAARQEASPNVVRILANIKAILNKKQTESAVTIASLKALAAIASSMEPSEQGALADLVPVLLAIIEKGEHQTEAWAVLLPLSKQLGPRIIPHFRTVVQQSVKALKQENTDVVYATLQALLASIPTFWSMPEVLAVLMLYINDTASASPSMPVLVKALTKRISAKVLLPSILDLWSKLQVSPNDRELAVFFEIVSRTLRSADRPAILETLRALFKMFVDGLTILKPGQEMEDNLIMAFRELVVKLNETAFRPLFRRLYDWAFAADTVNLDHQIVFIHLYAGLQDYFKNLMNPYMSFLLAPFSEILASYASGSSTNHDLWQATVSSLNRSFINDDGGFWRDDKLRAISTSLIQQVGICVKQQFNEDKPLLKETLVSLVEGVNDDALLKTINLNILMHTRSEEAQVRLFALVCSEALWQSHGNKLLGFVAETATFIAECGEDENDMVVKESFRLKDAVERIAGKIDGL
ncbi:armadillo-type protein [Ephemerocybe angulata]|uniref:U3 small nucleolar RNA-associated protein 10 n=1 Tax=Ephemerocybe angulata TaxID=980116 RepID=A0A8H6HS65_9AGAR|nr:armadillo-type protein [Tulosesus angulatus]